MHPHPQRGQGWRKGGIISSKIGFLQSNFCSVPVVTPSGEKRAGCRYYDTAWVTDGIVIWLSKVAAYPSGKVMVVAAGVRSGEISGANQ